MTTKTKRQATINEAAATLHKRSRSTKTETACEWCGSLDHGLLRCDQRAKPKPATNGRAAIAEAVAGRMVLATLTTSAWRATRLHKEETRAEAERHNTEAVRVSVRLCDHKALREIAKLDSQAYAIHREMTLGSVQEGFRLLPVDKQTAHAAAMSKIEKQREKFVAEFLADYDREKSEAPLRLNGLYDASAWPTHEEMQQKFGFACRYLNCPASDGSWKEFLEESAAAAENELKDRLREKIELVIERCNAVADTTKTRKNASKKPNAKRSPFGRLHESVFEGLTELAALVPDYDITGKFTRVAEGMIELGAESAEKIRDSGEERKRVADRASELLEMFGNL